jgi:hypothetical protein
MLAVLADRQESKAIEQRLLQLNRRIDSLAAAA